MFLSINLPAVFRTLYQIAVAAAAITSISLLMYAISFSFSERVVQTFVMILVSVVCIYFGETLASVSNSARFTDFFLRIKWIGLVLMPASYLHFTDALLTLTGRPSRGRRSLAVLLVDIISLFGALLVPFRLTIGNLGPANAPMPYLSVTALTFFFTIFFFLVMLMASYNLLRAYSRSATSTSRRRMSYLLAGAAAPALSSALFILQGYGFLVGHTVLFWIVSMLAVLSSAFFLLLMTYAMSFFGLRWTDRAIKSRLFRWMLRGPFVAAIVLAMTTIVRRLGLLQGNPYSPYVPLVMVGGILLLEYAINLLSPDLEKRLFWGSDRSDLETIQSLQDGMLTRRDLDQFLEMIAASICDRMQASNCFIAIISEEVLDYVVQTVGDKGIEALPFTLHDLQLLLPELPSENGIIRWKEYYLIPLRASSAQGETKRLLGLCGFLKAEALSLESEHLEAVFSLAERAALALKDRAMQHQVIETISSLQSEVGFIQDLRARAALGQGRLPGLVSNAPQAQLVEWVKEALTHYWGGPKLTESPLLSLELVENETPEFNGNRPNALRSVLKKALERLMPEGERKYIHDWLLYNILEMKFVQGKKVREVAERLSVSEADLYRKQRVALEALTQALVKMEQAALIVASDKAPQDSAQSHPDLVQTELGPGDVDPNESTFDIEYAVDENSQS